MKVNPFSDRITAVLKSEQRGGDKNGEQNEFSKWIPGLEPSPNSLFYLSKGIVLIINTFIKKFCFISTTPKTKTERLQINYPENK